MYHSMRALDTAEEEARLKAKSDERARSIAAEQISAAAEVKDDFEDGDMVAPKENGSTSGVAMALTGKGATPPSDLQATLKDKKFKEKVRGYSARFSAGYADTIGKRPTMEDKLVIFGQFGARGLVAFEMADGGTRTGCHDRRHRARENEAGGRAADSIAQSRRSRDPRWQP